MSVFGPSGRAGARLTDVEALGGVCTCEAAWSPKDLHTIRLSSGCPEHGEPKRDLVDDTPVAKGPGPLASHVDVDRLESEHREARAFVGGLS